VCVFSVNFFKSTYQRRMSITTFTTLVRRVHSSSHCLAYVRSFSSRDNITPGVAELIRKSWASKKAQDEAEHERAFAREDRLFRQDLAQREAMGDNKALHLQVHSRGGFSDTGDSFTQADMLQDVVEPAPVRIKTAYYQPMIGGPVQDMAQFRLQAEPTAPPELSEAEAEAEAVTETAAETEDNVSNSTQESIEQTVDSSLENQEGDSNHSNQREPKKEQQEDDSKTGKPKTGESVITTALKSALVAVAVYNLYVRYIEPASSAVVDIEPASRAVVEPYISYAPDELALLKATQSGCEVLLVLEQHNEPDPTPPPSAFSERSAAATTATVSSGHADTKPERTRSLVLPVLTGAGALATVALALLLRDK
jgi:hypothetical protein